MRLDRLVQFVSILFLFCFFLVCVIFIVLDHNIIKIIFPYSGILYFVMNYRIKGTIKL